MIEFAIVMAISGLMMTAAFQLYKTYLADRYLNESYEKQAVLSTSMSLFYATPGRARYPCPADPTLSIDDPNAGVEDCAAAWALAPNTCTGAGNTGICRVDGRMTPFGDPNPDPVFIGAVPYRTIKGGMEHTTACYSTVDGQPLACGAPNAYNPTKGSFNAVSMQDILDPWGYQMTYAVTGSQTSSIDFKSSYGAIAVETETGVSLIQPVGSAHFVIIAHGENHKGAYNRHGQRPFACTAGTVDTANCNLDATFVSGLRAVGDTVNYYDDIVLQRSFSMSELWKFNDSGDMYNANDGNVGIGTNTPIEKLDVEGDIRVATTRADFLCDRSGFNCWDPGKIGGAGMACPAPAPGMRRLSSGIRNAGQKCTEPYNELPRPVILPGQSCVNPGEYVVGFTSGGVLICAVP